MTCPVKCAALTTAGCSAKPQQQGQCSSSRYISRVVCATLELRVEWLCRGVGLIRCRQLLANDRNPRPESLLTARRERFMSSIFERCTWIYMLRLNWGFSIFGCCVWLQLEIDFRNCFVSALAINCFQRQHWVNSELTSTMRCGKWYWWI